MKCSNFKLYISAFIVGFAPGILLKVWEISTFNGADDFVKHPYGFLEYIAGFESIFLPMQGPIQEAETVLSNLPNVQT